MFLVSIATAHAAHLPSIVFFYGSHRPHAVLKDFDWVVVQPGSVALPERSAQSQSAIFAYVSLGELAMDTDAAKAMPSECRLGENPIWKSWIVDQAKPACRAFYLDHVFKPLRAQGYRNYFFDTLDSYRLTLKTQDQRAAYRTGLVTLIKAVHRSDPDGKFIFNRGFSLLAALKGQGVVAVAAESLYRGWNPRTQKYVAVKASDTAQLLKQLARVRTLGLTAVAIDYLPSAERDKSERLARRIEAQGIVPYVGNSALDIVGVSTIMPLPRRVLMLYDGPDGSMSNDLNWYAAMPLNHLGYDTRVIDVTRAQLPSGPLTGQIAGIVTWFDSDHFRHSARTWQWLQRQMKAGIPVVVLGHWGMPESSSVFASLGLRHRRQSPAGLNRARIAYLDPGYFGFESPVLPSAPDFTPIDTPQPGKPLLSIRVAGRTEVAAAITSWGGYVLSPYVVRSLPQGDLANGALQAAWILNPFRFFRAALRLPQVPAYDYTTVSGRRLLFGLIDGDGFSSLSWIGAFHDQPAAKVILTQILQKFPLPVTASVIASEFIDHGLLPPTEVATLRPIARKIFALPWVQIGSHTYSHPFDWRALERNPDLSAGLHIKAGAVRTVANVGGKRTVLKYGLNLPVPGYRFSPRMEITGSAQIIDKLLAPAGKRVRVIQWSGDTNPDARVLGIVYRDGLQNINGNNSTITRANPSLTNVAPVGVWKGPYFQVYSPIANEDQYTHGWQPPYCGYDKAIQTMQMTNRPRRLTAMEIYFHYYSGTRACALKQLQHVYRWAQRQPTVPVFASTYSRIAVSFESAGIAADGKGFLARGYGADQELRIPAALGYPDLADSHNIAGFDDFDGMRYIHLGPGGEALLRLQTSPPTEPYLKSANGLIEALARNSDSLELNLRARVPLEFTLGNATHCRTRIDGRVRPGKAVADGGLRFQLHRDEARVELACQS